MVGANLKGEIQQLEEPSHLAGFRTCLLWMSAVVMLGYLPFVVRNFALGRERVATIQLIACVAILGLVALERVTPQIRRKYWMGQAILALTMTAGFVGAVFTGQGRAVSAWVLLLGPLLGAYLFGRFSARLWTAMCLVALFVLHWSGQHYPVEADFVAGGWRVWGVQSIMTVVIFGFGKAFRRGQDRQVALLKQRSAELEQARGRLEESYLGLQNAEIARQQFVEMLAHDMRNPITGIVGYAQLLKDESGLSPEGLRMVDGIESLTRSLTDKLGDILDVVNLEHEQLDLCIAEIDYSDLCRQVVAGLQSELLPAVVFDGPGRLPLSCDSRLLGRVLSNLLGNAQKFCSGEKMVTLRVEVGPNEVITDILDHGPDLSPAEKAHAFENLPYHGEQPSKRSFGLGLTFCRLAVERHGGILSLDDSPEGGSRFRFTIPCTKVA